MVQTGSEPTWHTGSCTCLNCFHICAVFRLVSSMPGGAHNKACRRRETCRSVCRSVGLSGNKHAVNSYQQCGAWCLLLSVLHHGFVPVIKYSSPGLGLFPYVDMDLWNFNPDMNIFTFYVSHAVMHKIQRLASLNSSFCSFITWNWNGFRYIYAEVWMHQRI